VSYTFFHKTSSGKVIKYEINLFFVPYLLLFWWYAYTVIARPEPTLYVNFFWGLLHGVFVVPSYIVSLFNDNVAIYQTPNIFGWYNLGFLLGIVAFFKGANN